MIFFKYLLYSNFMRVCIHWVVFLIIFFLLRFFLIIYVYLRCSSFRQLLIFRLSQFVSSFILPKMCNGLNIFHILKILHVCTCVHKKTFSYSMYKLLLNPVKSQENEWREILWRPNWIGPYIYQMLRWPYFGFVFITNNEIIIIFKFFFDFLNALRYSTWSVIEFKSKYFHK